VRIVLGLSGETIVKSDVQIGYLHRGFEDVRARRGSSHCADRLSYVSPMLNNVGFSLACEVLGITVPRALPTSALIPRRAGPHLLSRRSAQAPCACWEEPARSPVHSQPRLEIITGHLPKRKRDGARVTTASAASAYMANPTARLQAMIRGGLPRVCE
jgi:NADH-quinone oxidoreductase subunit D